MWNAIKHDTSDNIEAIELAVGSAPSRESSRSIILEKDLGDLLAAFLCTFICLHWPPPEVAEGDTPTVLQNVAKTWSGPGKLQEKFNKWVPQLMEAKSMHLLHHETADRLLFHCVCRLLYSYKSNRSR